MKALFFPALFVLTMPALADGDRMAPVSDPATKAECSACHMAYPAGFLPKASWNRLMDGLADHFGEDASLPQAAMDEIRAYLTGAAPRSVRGVDNANPVLRISDLSWFQHEHGRARAKAEADPAIGSIANCVACHRGADRGLFDDD